MLRCIYRAGPAEVDKWLGKAGVDDQHKFGNHEPSQGAMTARQRKLLSAAILTCCHGHPLRICGSCKCRVEAVAA